MCVGLQKCRVCGWLAEVRALGLVLATHYGGWLAALWVPSLVVRPTIKGTYHRTTRPLSRLLPESKKVRSTSYI